MLSIDCLQKCDTGAALLSTCWRRYKPPSPFITPLNFMVFTILSAPCYLSKDFWFLKSWSVVFHSLSPCGCVCGDLRAWICESVTPWCQLKSSLTSSRHLLTFIPIFHVEPLNRSVATRIFESVALESQAETTCPCQAATCLTPPLLARVSQCFCHLSTNVCL